MSKIEACTAKIGVLGLGYVGLLLALAFSEEFIVLGYDVDSKKRKLLKPGKSYIDDVPSSELKQKTKTRLRVIDKDAQLKECDVIMICVPTPVDEHGTPDLSHIEHSSEVVRRVVRKDMLIVLESTIYPGDR